LALDEPGGNEVPVQINGLDVLIADNVKEFTAGNTVDYIKSAQGEGFTINKSGGSGCTDCSSC